MDAFNSRRNALSGKISAADGRERRAKTMVNLRRNKRLESLAKRRNAGPAEPVAQPSTQSATPASSRLPEQLSTAYLTEAVKRM